MSGVLRTINSILGVLHSGDLINPLNSDEELVVVFVTEHGVVLNTAEYMESMSLVRYSGETVDGSFPLDWTGLFEAGDYTVDPTPFSPEQFKPGIQVIFVNKELDSAFLTYLTKIDEKRLSYLTASGLRIPFSSGIRILPTGFIWDDDLKVLRVLTRMTDLPEEG